MKPYTIFLEEGDIEALRRLAKELGLRPGECARAILSSALRQELGSHMDQRAKGNQTREAT